MTLHVWPLRSYLPRFNFGGPFFGEEAKTEQADSSVDPDANRQHDSLQRQETSLEENQAQALNLSSMSFARDSCFSSMGSSIRFRRTSRLHLNVKLRLSLFSAP